jgi:hypothetical protein
MKQKGYKWCFTLVCNPPTTPIFILLNYKLDSEYDIQDFTLNHYAFVT